MIETGLVYVHSTTPTRRFVGCGALIEADYVATYRHVWRMATEAAAKARAEQPLEVEIEFPGSWQGGATIRHKARLVDSCEQADGPAPDLVLLRPQAIPSGVMTLQLAAEKRFEIGKGYVRAGLKGLNKNKPNDVQDVELKGEIAGSTTFDGRRQFTGDNPQSFWSMPGSSGSPVFRKDGQQLAGILSLSELGGRHEAFVVPGTTIRRYLVELVARQTPASESINLASLRPILEAMGASDVPVAEIPSRLKQYVDESQARGAEPVRPSNDGADIEAVIGASREKLRALDAVGARNVLQAKIAEEEEAWTRRRVPLLKERAAVERIAFDYETAKCTLAEIARLTPDDVWTWIDLGDLWLTTGALDNAAQAYCSAEAAARRTGDERDLAVSHNRIGDVLAAQGDRAGARDAHQAALAIREALARRDPANTQWQRDLAVSHERIGEVLAAQGDRAGARDAHQAALAIREALARRDPANTQWQRDLSVSHNRIGDLLVAQGDRAGARDAHQAALAIREALARRDPGNTEWQRDLSVSHNKIGDLLVAQGDRAGARDAHQAALAITEALARRDPANTQWQRDLSVSHNKIGDLLVAQGDRAGARDAHQAALAIREALARRDPGNTQWQRDLAVSHERIGDVLAAQGDRAGARDAHQAALAIREALARRDPANTQWQRDLSVSHNKIGDLLVAQGDRAGARDAHQAALAIREALARRDPANTQWQRDLSVSHNKIGGLLAAQGDRAGARDAYQAALAIREALARRDPANTEWQRDLIISCVKISEVSPAEARPLLVRALDIARRLEAAGQLATVDARMPSELARRLAEL